MDPAQKGYTADRKTASRQDGKKINLTGFSLMKSSMKTW